MRVNPKTREMGEWVDCPKCKERHTKETAFERWVRNHPKLDSRTAGIVRFDLDVLLHLYMTKIDGKGRRELQAMMFIEVKTNWGEATQAQADTLHILNQLLNNRKPNIHGLGKGARAKSSVRPVAVRSLISRKLVHCWLMGGHCLRMDGADPPSSNKMEWDHKPITCDQLIGLLTFELDPHDPEKKIDWRRRYASFQGNSDLQMKLVI